MKTEEPGSPTKRFQCPSCPKHFQSPFGLKEHLLIKHVQDAESYPCDKCIGKNNLPKVFKTEQTFKTHFHQVHGSRDRFKCHVCFKISSNSGSLRKHLLSHNQNIQKKFKCEFCLKTIGTKQHFREHLFLVHKKKTPGVKYFKCELCSLECVSRFWLERHVVDKHVVDKEFKCTFCANTFIDQPTLDKHKKYHHTQNKICDVCSTGFIDKKTFMLHLEKEHLKFFYCGKCSTSFSNKSEFNQHLDSKPRISKQKSEFKCNICSTSFDSQCNLSIHTKCHLKETKSEVVSKTTNPSDPEPKLIKTQLTKKVFRCCSCELHFSSLRWLLEHRQRVHLEKFEAEKQTHRNIEFLDGVVYICSSSKCRFDTVCPKQVAIHYNKQHQLPKVLLKYLSGNVLKMENKSVRLPSSSTFTKNISKRNYKKKAERIIERLYKCKICSGLFQRMSELNRHQGTHSKLT